MSSSIFRSLFSLGTDLARIMEKAERQMFTGLKPYAQPIVEKAVAERSSTPIELEDVSYSFPTLDILKTQPNQNRNTTAELKGERLISILKTFQIKAEVIEIISGASVTMFVTRLDNGIKVSRLKNLVEDIELNLPAKHVRIVPLPKRMAIGVEVPNDERDTVYFRDVLSKIDKTKYNIPFVLGTNILNEPVCIDVTKTPHLLIAGATGSGKSVCINNLVASILYSREPNEVRMIFVDPKKVELSVYNGIPHLIGKVITEADETIEMLDSLIEEMNRRYNLLERINCRNIESYNSKAQVKLKYILLVMDEFADLMATNQKDIEPRIAKLTAMARAVGIHLVLATQRPSSDVITGVIKANIPSRIAFQVSSSINSRIILDESGAEKLMGKGDMLLSLSSEQDLQRIQGAYLSDDEVESLVNELT